MQIPTMPPKKWRKKPVVIEAAQVPPIDDADGYSRLNDWLIERSKKRKCKPVADGIEIETLEGTMLARVGDYIICGVQGEVYPCKPDIFEATYEPA